LKPKSNKIGLFGILGFTVAVVLTVPILSNGFANFASAQKQFVAELSGSNEVPPVSTIATGVAKFQLSADGQSLNYQINVTNINAIMGAHIHSGKQGQNGPVVAGLFNPNMGGPPMGKVNGLLVKGTLNSTNLEGPLTGHPLTDLVHLITGHGAYVNVYTQQHQNGEIRGQIA
jgi:hypothetical protein